MRLLVAEDDKDLNRLISKKMTLEGYTVDSCFNGQDAYIYILNNEEYDAVIMDVMMPKIDGFEVLKKVRAKGINVPVLYLTARDSIEDRVNGLDIGADDYLVKPFSFKELSARIRVITRRKSNNVTNVFIVSDLEVDTEKHLVKRNNINIELSVKEYAVLEYLIRNKDIVLSREKIENHIYNFDYEGGSNLIDVYIRYLRKKIDEGFENKLIHTVRGSGYVLREEQIK